MRNLRAVSRGAASVERQASLGISPAAPLTSVATAERSGWRAACWHGSLPVRSEFGWHILEVTGRRTEDFSEQVRRNQVASYLREAKYEEELENWLREIREEAFVDIK